MRRKAFLCGWLACLCLSSCSGTAQVEYADLPFPSSQSVVEGLEPDINVTSFYPTFSEKDTIENADVIAACTVRDSKILAEEPASILRYTLEIKDVYKEGEKLSSPCIVEVPLFEMAGFLPDGATCRPDAILPHELLQNRSYILFLKKEGEGYRLAVPHIRSIEITGNNGFVFSEEWTSLRKGSAKVTVEGNETGCLYRRDPDFLDELEQLINTYTA